MKFELNKERILLYLTLFLCGVIFFILNVLTPEFLDDYLYKYKFINGVSVVTCPIHNFKDIILSQIDHYYTFNGRSIIHFFVQLFTGILGKDIFNYINSIIFVAFLLGITKYTFKIITWRTIIMSTLFVFLFMPSFNDTCLWMTGSINYLWTLTSVTFFLLLFNHYKNIEFRKIHWLLMPLALFVGWSHEGIIFPLVLGLFFSLLFSRIPISKNAVLPLLVGVICGACFCTFSPATLNRGSFNDNLSFTVILQKIFSGFTLLLKLKAFYLLIICLFLAKRNKRLFPFIKQNLTLFLTLIFSLGIIFAAGFTSSRTAIGVEFISLLISLKILSEFNLSKKVILPSLSYLFFIILSCNLLYYSTLNNKESEKIVTKLATGSGYIIKTNECIVPSFFERYIRKPLISENSEYYENYSCSNWENKFIAATYHRDSIAFIPNKFFEYLATDSKVYNDFDITLDLPFYCKEIKDHDKVKKVKFVLNPTNFNELSLCIKFIAPHLERYNILEVDQGKFSILIVDNRKYLLVSKNSFVTDRVKSIEVEYV